MEPTCHLPTSSSLPLNSATSDANKLDKEEGNSGRRSTSNECAICMNEYDIGDVIIYNSSSAGGGCRHAFHQHCVLDWFSRENIHCPSCRSVFYDPDSKSLKKKKEQDGNSNNNSGDSNDGEGISRDDENEGRPRSDTADTEALSVIVEENSNNYSGGEQQGPRLGQSFDSHGEVELPSVVEDEAAVS